MSKELLNLTNLFHKLATSGPKISVVENTDPVLKELSEIKDFDERVEFAKEQDWELLGEGSARIVFQMDEKRIIKVALGDAGLAQNITEADPEKQKFSITNPVFCFDPKGAWIISSMNETITIQEFKKLTNMSFESFGNALKYKFNHSDDRNPPKGYEDIENNPVFKETAQLILNEDMLEGDVAKISSWGRIDNKVVLRDEGLDLRGWIENYKDSGEAKSSSRSKSDTSSS